MDVVGQEIILLEVDMLTLRIGMVQVVIIITMGQLF
jgi:hypothetical protein